VSDPLRLLLVDDDPSNLLTLGAVLEDAGFAVATAECGAQARALLEEGADFVAAIVDRNLAGEDGLALAASIRAARPSAALLIFSGDAPPETPLEGIDGWLVKGSAVEELIESVRSCVEPTARSDQS